MATDLSINKFISELKNGIALPNRYRISFNLPAGVPASHVANFDSQKAFIRGKQQQLNGSGAISVLCHTAQMPERMLNTYEHKQNVMPYRVPYSQSYNPTTFTFYADAQMNTRVYFDIWQQAIVNVHDNTMHFISEYTSDIDIFVLDKEGNDTYGIRLIEAYPMTISAVDLSYSNNTAQNITVTFSYKYWHMISDDRRASRTV